MPEMTKQAAEEKARALIERMDSDGWRVRTWFNAGWYYAIENGPVSVFWSSGGYHCLIGKDPGASGNALWTTQFMSDDPNLVVEHEVANARTVIRELEEIVERAEAVTGVLT